MTTTRRMHCGTATCAALLTALALPTLASAQEQANPQQQGAPTDQAIVPAGQPAAADVTEEAENGEEKKETRQLKIFELKHRTPQEINTLLGMRQHGQPVAGGGGFPGGRAVAGFRGAPAGGALIAMDADKKLIFARGTESELEKLEKVVKAFDAADGEMQEYSLDGMHILPVRQADASQISGILTQLQIPSRGMNLGETSLIVLHADEEDEEEARQLEQAREIIAKLEGKDRAAEEEQEEGEKEEGEKEERQDEADDDDDDYDL